tara:strand:- start:656 stop:787 length:132 start_codon:yes stop_codon:yes gene_type:complete
LYCEECHTSEIVTGCPFCLKEKILQLKEEIKFYRNELELIKEE